MELALIVITSYYFFAISEGGFFEFKWSFEDFANAFFSGGSICHNFIFTVFVGMLFFREADNQLKFELRL